MILLYRGILRRTNSLPVKVQKLAYFSVVLTIPTLHENAMCFSPKRAICSNRQTTVCCLQSSLKNSFVELNKEQNNLLKVCHLFQLTIHCLHMGVVCLSSCFVCLFVCLCFKCASAIILLSSQPIALYSQSIMIKKFPWLVKWTVQP